MIAGLTRFAALTQSRRFQPAPSNHNAPILHHSAILLILSQSTGLTATRHRLTPVQHSLRLGPPCADSLAPLARGILFLAWKSLKYEK
jgi:hypothetical protein